MIVIYDPLTAIRWQTVIAKTAKIPELGYFSDAPVYLILLTLFEDTNKNILN